MNIFGEGSLFIRFLNKTADLLILNLLTLIMCLPIVTAGASLTAMHYVLLKMVRNEEGYIIKSFFRSFRRNFVQATILWLLYVALAALMVSNLIMILEGSGHYPLWLPSSILVVGLLEVMFMIYTFAMLSRFENTVAQTLINAVTLTFAELPRSLEMLVITLVPLIACLWVNALFPFLILFGFSVPGYACAMVYNPLFKKLEKQIWEEQNREYPDDV